ncbi:MAG: WD40 repeat domain-containing serine/threonine-protein kinase [Pirellulaceae bacterium]
MSSAPLEPPESDAEARITLAMESYLAELESGGSPDINAYLQQFPDIADLLRPQLESIAFLHDAAPPMAPNPRTVSEHVHDINSSSMIGDYRLIRPIGRGGMGIVYEAEQTTLGRRVALKVLPAAAAVDSRQLARFRNEAMIVGQLSHPHIVSVIDVGQANHVHFIAMEYIDGRSLEQLITDWRQEDNFTTPLRDPSSGRGSARSGRDELKRLRMSAEYCCQVASALEYAHQLSILHRDVKPSNVMVNSSNKALLTDFGLARIADVNLTMSGDILGTMRYMSPEQASGDQTSVGPCSDVYSLGTTLYELVTLQPIYGGDHRGEILKSVLSGTTKAPRVLNPHIPKDLETIILKATQSYMGDRYHSAQELCDDLERFLRDEPIQARRLSPIDWISKWTRRNQFLAIAGVATTTLLMMAFAISTLLVWRAQIQTRNALIETKRQTSQAEDLLYLADVKQAYQAWELERMDQVEEILDRHLPKDNELDRRDFAWHLLKSMAKQPEATVIGSHQGAANEVAVFPDGERFVSVGDDGALRVWHIPTRSLLNEIDTGGNALFSVAISPDGESIATGSTKVQIWNAQSGDREMVLTEEDANAESIAFSPDGQKIAVGFRYDKVFLFARSGELIRSVDAKSRFESLEFSKDGKRILVPSRIPSTYSNSTVEYVRIWKDDLTSVDRDFVSESGPNAPFGRCKLATVAPSGQFFALSGYGDGGYTILADAESGKVLLTLPWEHSEIKACAISADEQVLAAGFDDGTIDYWQLERSDSRAFLAPERKYSIRAHRGQVRSIRFAEDNQLISCGHDGHVKTWHLGLSQSTRRTPRNVSAIECSRNVTFIARGDVIERIDHNGKRLELTVEEANFVTVDHAADQNLLAVFCNDRQVLELRSSESLQVIRDVHLDESAYAIACSPTQNKLAVCTMGRVRFFGTEELAEQTPITFDVEKIAYTVEFASDGKVIAYAGNFGEITVVDAITRERIHSIPTHSPTKCLTFDSTSNLLASGHDDGSICLWNWVTCEPVAVLTGYEGVVRDLSFSPNGSILASISSRGAAQLWSVRSAREIGVICRGLAGWTVAFSSDGHTIHVGYQRKLVTLRADR